MTTLDGIDDLIDHLGFRRTTDNGTVFWELPVAPHVVNYSGGLQGGLLATLVDIAAGSAVLEQRPPGTGVVTSDMNIRYLRAVTTGVARAHTRIVHTGRRSTIVEVEIRDSPTEAPAVVATANFAHVDFTAAGIPPKPA